jgi:hypothetical protein
MAKPVIALADPDNHLSKGCSGLHAGESVAKVLE